jgi:hypothetical protein
MEHILREKLKILAELILDDQHEHDLESLLNTSREIYEKYVILQHLEKEEKSRGAMEFNMLAEEDSVIKKKDLSEEVKNLAVPEMIAPEINESVNIKISEPIEEDDSPMSLTDLFVPTFNEIKEDMSQKDEFKDTISLDETENMFVTKKEEPRQLSLNDKLLGSSIQVGLNDRIAFVNKLFNFSQSDFNKVLTKLNSYSSREEAIHYFQYQVKPNYNWKGKEDLEERFILLIERKFL